LLLLSEDFSEKMMQTLLLRRRIWWILLVVVGVALFIADLLSGSVSVAPSDVWAALTGRATDPMLRDIVLKIRLVKAIVAVVAGAALAVSGLLMQTLFRNPLAGPYVLGINSGASFGVALFLLGAPLVGIGSQSWLSYVGVTGAAWLGAAAVLLLIMAVSRRIKDIMVILILGMMFGSAVGALVEVLQYLSNEAALKSFVVWTMGSLGDVSTVQLVLLLTAVAVGLCLTCAAVKSLNLLLLGEHYARTMGLHVAHSRRLILLATTLLSGTVTACCGPIGFVGLAVPHLARMLFASADHRILMPASIGMGASMLLLCDICSKHLALPINTLTALMGIPVVVWVVIRNKRIV
jgi:iron complex transport system permease protein